jgi:autotransporter translocation and assembly factor TamB
LRQSYIRTQQTSITLDGKVSEDSQLQVALRSGNLHELELLAENFRTAPSGQTAQKLDLYGTASFSGFVSGPANVPQLKGQLEAHNLRVKGTYWKLLRTDIDASPSSLSFSNGDLEAETQGQTGFSDSASPINLEVSASRFAGIKNWRH